MSKKTRPVTVQLRMKGPFAAYKDIKLVTKEHVFSVPGVGHGTQVMDESGS